MASQTAYVHEVQTANVDPAGEQIAASSPASLLSRLLLKKRYHCSDDSVKENLWSPANAATGGRIVVVAIVLVVAAIHTSRTVLLMALFVNWVCDITDGHIARKTRQETVFGAQFDYSADRLLAAWVLIVSAALEQGSMLSIVAGSVVWLQYGVIDQMLCTLFLRTKRWSPDELWLVDEKAWRLNWSPVAKISGHIPLLLVVVGKPMSVASIGVAITLIMVRWPSYLRIARKMAGQDSALDPARLPGWRHHEAI